MDILEQVENARAAMKHLEEKLDIDPSMITEALSAFATNLGMSALHGKGATDKEKKIATQLAAGDINAALDIANKLGEEELHKRTNLASSFWVILEPLLSKVVKAAILSA